MNTQVKKGRLILGIIILAILGGVMSYVFRVTSAKAEITINGVTYEMGTVSVRDFMGDDYLFAIMSTEGNSVYMYNYTDAERRVWCPDCLLALQSDFKASGNPGRNDLFYFL